MRALPSSEGGKSLSSPMPCSVFFLRAIWCGGGREGGWRAGAKVRARTGVRARVRVRSQERVGARERVVQERGWVRERGRGGHHEELEHAQHAQQPQQTAHSSPHAGGTAETRHLQLLLRRVRTPAFSLGGLSLGRRELLLKVHDDRKRGYQVEVEEEALEVAFLRVGA